MPHLSSSKKEKERRTLICHILQELLRHNKTDWTDETMKAMPSMFDDDDINPPNRLWYRLAMNLLYTGKNKNIAHQVSNATFDRTSNKKRLMEMSAQSFSSTLVSAAKNRGKSNANRNGGLGMLSKKSEIASK